MHVNDCPESALLFITSEYMIIKILHPTTASEILVWLVMYPDQILPTARCDMFPGAAAQEHSDSGS